MKLIITPDDDVCIIFYYTASEKSAFTSSHIGGNGVS